MRRLPALVCLDLPLTGDRCGDGAGIVAEFDHHKTERWIQQQARVGLWRTSYRRLRLDRLPVGYGLLASSIGRGSGRGNGTDNEIVWHGGFDRDGYAILALETTLILLPKWLNRS
jgi:hypothetical protein